MPDFNPPPPDQFKGRADAERNWRDFQPSLSEALLYSIGTAGAIGLLFVLLSGRLGVLPIAAIGGGLLFIYFRWVQPLYQHLWWGDQ